MIWERLLKNASDRPHSLALSADNHALSWKELLEFAELTANSMLAGSIRPGDRIALVLPNGSTLVSALLAVARLGAVAVPLSPDLHPNELLKLISRSQCSFALFENPYPEVSQRLFSETTIQSAYITNKDAPCISDLQEFPPPKSGFLNGLPLPDDDSPLVCLLTSGTTGLPKRIERSHRQTGFLAESYVDTTGIEPNDRIYTIVPVSHGHGFCSGFLASLQSSAALYLDTQFQRRPTLTKLSQEKITICSAVPFLYHILADTRMTETMDYSALRMCVSGAGGMRRDRWLYIRNQLGFEVRQSYGSVETGALTINMDLDIESTCDSVGKPLKGVLIEIRDLRNQTTDGIIAGHVFSRSPATGRLLENSQANRRDPEGWIAMQDFGHFDNAGRLYLDGRLQGIVNVAGRKVSTTEVEQVLLKHPKVALVKVVPCQDAYGEEAVRAILVLKAPCGRSELLDHCRLALSEYKVPRVFDVVDSLDNV